jgi:type VI secretion system protein ImpH
MDPAKRQPAHRLVAADELDARLQAAARQGFYALVASIERFVPEAARVGGAGPSHAEAIIFRHDPSLSFSASDITSVATAKGSAKPALDEVAPSRFEVTTTFLGLTGADSPLPEYLVDDLAGEEHAAQRDFLDIFHHRLISFLYRLVTKYDLAADFESSGHDVWSRRVVALGGTDAYTEGKSQLPVLTLLRLAPLLATGPRNARSLELALEEMLRSEIGGASISIVEFVGAWVEVAPDQLTRLGRANSRLGTDFILGKRAFDASATFRLRIGPVSSSVCDRFRPQGDLLPVIKEVVEWMLGNRLAYDLEITIAGESVPRFVLSRSRLSRDTWLGGASLGERRVIIDAMS